MHRINQMPEQAIGGEDILLEMVQGAETGATDLEADFLHALAHTTPFPKVRQAAERALARLAAAGVKPVTRQVTVTPKVTVTLPRGPHHPGHRHRELSDSRGAVDPGRCMVPISQNSSRLTVIARFGIMPL